MGTLLGHVVPASYFLVMGFWWTWNIFRNYYKSKCKNGKPFNSLPWYPGPFCKNFPFESAAKVGMTVLLVAGTITSEILIKLHRFKNDAQHVTMYTFFGLTGVVELLKHFSTIVPDNIDRLSMVLAFAIEGFIFQNHLHGLKPMEIQVHILLFYVVVGCTLSAFLEMMNQESFIFSFSKAYFVLLQATWLYQVGFILYHPFGLQSWDLENHEQMMFVSLIFSFHFGVVFLLMIILGGCVWLYMKKTHQLDEINYYSLPPDSLLASVHLKFNGQSQGEKTELLDSDKEFI